MNCKNCGNLVHPGNLFCENCGTKVEQQNQNIVNQNAVNPTMTQNPNVVNSTMAQNPNVVNPTMTQNPNVVNPTMAQNPNVVNPTMAQNPNVVNPTMAQNPNVVNSTMAQNPNVVNPTMAQNPNVANPTMAQNPNVANPTMAQNPNVDMDEELLKSYVGKNYEKLVNNKFNVPMFFLGGIYVIYRKMFLFLLILLAINIIFGMIPVVGNFSIILNIAYAFLFNNLYIKYAKNKVQKIKTKNPNSGFEQLKNICSRKGGTSLPLAIVTPILLVVLMFIILIPIVFLGIIGQTDYSDIKGYKWQANDDSVIYLYEDDTFIWYKDDGVYYDNYYTGKYVVYKGEEAIKYVANDLNYFGVTEEEQYQIINSQSIENPLDNYYVLVIENQYLVMDGEEQEYSKTTYYLGMYFDSYEYLDLVNLNTANYSGFTRVYKLY